MITRKFTRREIARHRCKDCGVNVIKAGDYCMIRSEIWKGDFGLGEDDNLCLACIEQRLGRPLTRRDMSSFPVSIEGHPMSDTLAARWGSQQRKQKRRTKQRTKKQRKRPT